ncbi:PIN domain-containing protein [Paenarthrobacter sp. YIM B13468]|uniref:PIN domain-containing protein n=1 Tax=Paenarthrobacter sp. YIM B13468 TaxID=3366295 RepID=UPI00366BD246
MTAIVDVTSESDETGPGAIGFLSAVQRVLKSSRPSTEADLLSAAACQFLRRSHRATSEEVRQAVSKMWPGSQPTPEQVNSALALAKELRLVGVNEDAEWFLTAEGLADVQRHGEWVTDLRERTMADLRVRSREGLGYEPDSTEAALWLNQLVKALIAGIEKSQAAYLGEVEQLIQGQIVPREVKSADILGYLDEVSSNEEVVELLKSLALAALDPLDSFGKELVSLITTGCILHSYVSGRSGAEITSEIGSPEGQRAILDTPVLLSLVGRKSDRTDTELTIRSAAAAGWDVVVCRHSLDELYQLLRREIPEVEKRVREAHKRNTRVEFYAALVEDQIHGICIAALKDGTYKNLSEMMTTFERLEEDLVSWGATVRDHNNELSLDRVARCLDALQGQIDKGQRAWRSSYAIERDADTMAMAWRRRSREQSKAWPGAWVITSDRQMAPAYSSISSDRVSLTLSLPQWTTVVSISAPVENLRDLASAAAGQFAEEAMWQLPARFSGDFAMRLAAQLSPNQGGSDMDLRHAQMMLSLPDMLDELEVKSSPTTVAATVLAARTKRVDAMMQQEKERQIGELARVTVEASEADDQAREARIRELEIGKENAELANQLEQARAQVAASDNALTETKTRNRRVLWSIGLCLITAVAPVLGVLANNSVGTLVGLVALAGMITIATRWCKDLKLVLPVLAWTFIVDGVGFASALLPMLGIGQSG